MAADAPIGRDAEVDVAVMALRADATAPRLVLIRGEAGIGKSTVFASIVGLIEPDLVIRAAEAESRLPYAALGDLLGERLLAALPGMPAARAEALSAALGIGAPGASGPDARAVALGARDVLAEMLDRGPVTMAIDDVQWLDQETEVCLSFVLRRLADRGLGMFLAMRSGSASGLPLGLSGNDDLTVIDLEPLPAGELGAVITRQLHRALPRPTLVRVHEMSRGNPLLALELARHLSDDAAPDELPTTPDVERLIGRRVRDLTRQTIELLILAAASGRPTVDLLAAATDCSAVECATRLGPEATDGLVDVDGGIVRFAHPLFVSAVLNSVSPGARVDAHRRLSALTFGAERALHLAAAASGPDEAVASVIEAEAGALARRGAPASAASLMERAAGLSPDPMSTSRRRVLAAALYTLAGDGGRAHRLNSLAVVELPPGPIRARARAGLFTAASTQGDLALALVDAGDDEGALALVHWSYAQSAFLHLDHAASMASAEAAIEHAERAGDTTTMVAAMVQLGFSRNLRRPGSGLAVLYEAAALPYAPVSSYDSAVAKIALNQTAMDDLDAARVTLVELAATCRSMGDDGGLAGMCIHLVELEVRAGDLPAAREWLRTGREVSAGDGEWQSAHIEDYLESLILGREGDGPAAVATASRGLVHADATGDTAFSLLLAHAAAVGHLHCGRPQEALDLLTSARESFEAGNYGEPGVIRFHGPEIEALLALGRLDEARRRIVELDALGSDLDRPRLLGEAALGRGLLLEEESDGQAGIAALEDALEIFDLAGLPWERERARLALGVTLRRARQRSSARVTLDEAARGFAQLGAFGWADTARAESARISGRARSEGDLTPIEETVADLVATGLPNKEVAARLFLSPKTVESHLSRIYAKTGVKSRTELAAMWIVRRAPGPD